MLTQTRQNTRALIKAATSPQGGPLNTFTYLGSSVSSTDNHINVQWGKAWTVIDWLSVIWKSDLTDKIKRSFFQAAVVSMLLYRCTTWTLTKRMEKRLDGNSTRMLRAVLNKSWRQHFTKQQLYSHLPLIAKTIQVWRTRRAWHCWRSKDELIRDILLWTSSHGRANVGWPARTYIQQVCANTGYSMDDRDGWRERVREVCTSSTTWWWWWCKEKWGIQQILKFVLFLFFGFFWVFCFVLFVCFFCFFCFLKIDNLKNCILFSKWSHNYFWFGFLCFKVKKRRKKKQIYLTYLEEIYHCAHFLYCYEWCVFFHPDNAG